MGEADSVEVGAVFFSPVDGGYVSVVDFAELCFAAPWSVVVFVGIVIAGDVFVAESEAGVGFVVEVVCEVVVGCESEDVFSVAIAELWCELGLV